MLAVRLPSETVCAASTAFCTRRVMEREIHRENRMTPKTPNVAIMMLFTRFERMGVVILVSGFRRTTSQSPVGTEADA